MTRLLGLALLLATVSVLFFSCGDASQGGQTAKSLASVRAERRYYDGAPPVIPHTDFGPHCVACHTDSGMEVPGVGYAPAMPHGETLGLSEKSRCLQCHAFKQTDEEFRSNAFVGIPQDLRPGTRAHPLAPPVIPHGILMRENCKACHTGPSAREEIRCDHAERVNCRQCHVPSFDASPVR
ncbi:MAG TPA: hypothetical protein PKA37_07355 [Planctomycetota bacterium]|nr:hypothetical protein [Planctomycetota bacterium]